MPAQRDLPADDAALYFTLFPAQACENGRAGREAPRARSVPGNLPRRNLAAWTAGRYTCLSDGIFLSRPARAYSRCIMPKCDYCPKVPMYGNNRPWSKKATRRRWNLNVQNTRVMENGQLVRRRLCTACLRSHSR